MTGCFSWYSSVEFSRRPPTRSSPLESTKGSSCNRFECFGTDFSILADDNPLSSAGKTSFCTALITTWPACSSSAADGVGRGMTGLFESAWFLSLNFLINAIRLAIARLRKDQLEKRLNLSQPRLWGECVAVAQVITSLVTSGSLSLRGTSRSEAWGWSCGFRRNSGPSIHGDSTSFSGVMQRVARSAGFLAVSMYLHWFGAVALPVSCTWFAT